MSKREFEPADLGFVLTLIFLLIFFGGFCYYMIYDGKETINHLEKEKEMYYQYKLDSLRIATKSNLLDSIQILDSTKTK